jgi:hypothetical protein
MGVGAETIAAQRSYLSGAAASLRGNLAGNICWNCADCFLDLVYCFVPYFRRPRMVLKKVSAAVIFAVLTAWSGLSVADEYRADEFLGLDLPNALLSPTPLGPPSHFVPGPLDATVDRGGEGAQVRAEPNAEPKIAEPRPESKTVVRTTRIVPARAERAHAEERPIMHAHAMHTHADIHARAERPRGAAQAKPGKLARQHTNPLDAQAFDTRIQVWPCSSGGICNWKR